MLIRFIVNNIFSFGKEREFNMLPYARLNDRLMHHLYPIQDDFSLLKMAAIYGANGAGKSNLIKCLSLLQEIVATGKVPIDVYDEKFLLNDKKKKESQLLGIEFVAQGKPFLYAIELNDGLVQTEELYQSALGKGEDVLIFERKTNRKGITTTRFHEAFEADEESRVLKKVIEKTLIKPAQPAFKLLSELENDYLNEVRQAFHWFTDTLNIIFPDTKPISLTGGLSLHHNDYNEFANEIIRSFSTGIESLSLESTPIAEYMGDNTEMLKEITQTLKYKPQVLLELADNERIVVVRENGEIIAKRVMLQHSSKTKPTNFYLSQESDGTNRLLDYIPMLYNVLRTPKVYIIDEVERSLHATLIKEILRKFSEEKDTKGQLIFTSHESHLLDQDILRPDEIWFVEKDKWGCSDMYALSEFKEHKTKDIRKGYLNGRYGAIPFLGNLKDLNWTKYAATEQAQV